MYTERAKNDCGPRKSLTPAPANYYSTIARSARGTEILNIATLAMDGSVYANPDQVKPGKKDMHLEPMYIDVVERSKPRKKSRKMKCLVAWLVILTLTSVASLALTTIIFYSTLGGNSDSSKNDDRPSLGIKPSPSGSPLRDDLRDRLDQISKNLTFLLKKVANVSKMPGPRGPQGLAGFTGRQGPRGYNGTNGAPGAPGARGDPGIQGSMGHRGPPGVNGTRGERGAMGSQGPVGGNLSSCTHHADTEKGKKGTRNSVHIDEGTNEKIISATCWSDDALTYNLTSQKLSGGKYRYKCVCEGTRNTIVILMKCTINYWQCEL